MALDIISEYVAILDPNEQFKVYKVSSGNCQNFNCQKCNNQIGEIYDADIYTTFKSISSYC